MKFLLSEVLQKQSCLFYLLFSLYIFAGNAYSAAGQHFLAPGQQLQPDQSLRSLDGSKMMQFQTDGNLVIKEVSSGTVIWHSHTYDRVPGRVTMQHDGNLVMYEYGQPIWNTGTYDMTSQSVTLFLFNSGVAVLQTQAKEYVWGSDGNYRICERLVPDSSELMPTVNATITATTNSRLMPQPHLKCKVDTLVRPNDSVAIQAARGEWRYVTINGQNQGWVWKGVLSNDLDLQTPEMIDVAITDITHNKVSFKFFGQDNTDVAKYRLYLNGSEMGDVSGSVTQKTFQIEPNTWTTVAARVIDSAGNVSDYKNDARWSSPTPATIPTLKRSTEQHQQLVDPGIQLVSEPSIDGSASTLSASPTPSGPSHSTLERECDLGKKSACATLCNKGIKDYCDTAAIGQLSGSSSESSNSMASGTTYSALGTMMGAGGNTTDTLNAAMPTVDCALGLVSGVSAGALPGGAVISGWLEAGGYLTEAPRMAHGCYGIGEASAGIAQMGVGAGVVGGGGLACLTGVGCLLGAPAAGAGTLAIAEGAVDVGIGISIAQSGFSRSPDNYGTSASTGSSGEKHSDRVRITQKSLSRILEKHAHNNKGKSGRFYRDMNSSKLKNMIKETIDGPSKETDNPGGGIRYFREFEESIGTTNRRKPTKRLRVVVADGEDGEYLVTAFPD